MDLTFEEFLRRRAELDPDEADMSIALAGYAKHGGRHRPDADWTAYDEAIRIADERSGLALPYSEVDLARIDAFIVGLPFNETGTVGPRELSEDEEWAEYSPEELRLIEEAAARYRASEDYEEPSEFELWEIEQRRKKEAEAEALAGIEKATAERDAWKAAGQELRRWFRESFPT